MPRPSWLYVMMFVAAAAAGLKAAAAAWQLYARNRSGDVVGAVMVVVRIAHFPRNASASRGRGQGRLSTHSGPIGFDRSGARGQTD
jgi:hypothetical protein